MQLARRPFLHLAAGAAALPAASRIALAQAYPTRPVRIVVPFAPAGASDITARLIGPWLSERLGQKFIIENRPGAASNIGTEVVARAAPDGHTLLLVSSAAAINATLYDKLSFDFVRDITLVASIVRIPLFVAVNQAVPAKTLPEFIAYSKVNPGKINFASAGSGSPNHMAAELFKMLAGVNLVHVPYRGGGPALIDLLGGQVQVMFPTVAASIEYIRANKLRALAVTATTRLGALGDIPTVAEFVAGYEATDWYGLAVPRSTPTEIIDRLDKEVNAALADPAMKARLADLGGTLLPGSPGDFRKLLVEDIEKWGKVIRAANIKPE